MRGSSVKRRRRKNAREETTRVTFIVTLPQQCQQDTVPNSLAECKLFQTGFHHPTENSQSSVKARKNGSGRPTVYFADAALLTGLITQILRSATEMNDPLHHEFSHNNSTFLLAYSPSSLRQVSSLVHTVPSLLLRVIKETF